MKFVALTIVLVVLLLLFGKYIEALVMPLFRKQRVHHERISSLETHEVTQDIRIHDQSSAIRDQGAVIYDIRKEVRELGTDIGWDDNKRVTEVIVIDEPVSIHERETPLAPEPDDEPPPEAA